MEDRPARWWKWLLFAYPAEFRQEYGLELVEALHGRSIEVRGASRIKFFLEAIGDLIATAGKERYRVMFQDIKHSIRRLIAHPAITAIAVLSLALGIGANTAMFSVVYATLLRPLPYPDSDRLMILMTTNLNSPNRENRDGATSADFIDWRSQSTTLQDWHLTSGGGVSTAIGAGLPERITTHAVTPGLLESLGVRPVIGRLFRPGEEAEHPAVIGEGYWRRRFGQDPNVLGKTLTIEGQVHTIVGVVPASFELSIFRDSTPTDLWNTVDLAPGSIWVQRRVPWLMALAKLKPGVSVEQAQSEMNGIAASLSQAYPESNRYRGVIVTSMLEMRNRGVGSTLYSLLGAVGFVLLIACTNVANLLLARASARRREISVRAALGASRGRLIREFLADGMVLALAGVGIGLAVAYGGLALFRAMAPEGFVSRGSLELNLPVLAFTIAAAALAGILCALFPALSASKVELTEALKEGGRGSAGRSRQRLRSTLVAAEIALALILLVGAGLTINSLMRLRNQNLGFDPADVTIAQLHITGNKYMTNAPQREIDMRYVEPPVALFIDHLLRETRALPGVDSAALAGGVPMGPYATPGARVRVSGSPDADAELRAAMFNVVTSGFFETVRIPLRRGRVIDDRDSASAAWVAVVNEAFAREFFPKGEALGQVITLKAGPDERPREIVGVVADFYQFTPRIPARPEVFTSYFQQTREIPGNFQAPRFRPKLIVRSGVAPSSESLAKIVAGFDKELAIFDVSPHQKHVDTRSSGTRFYANALGLFSAIAVALAAIGIYGLMSYSVTDRVHEIGIRLSLGATRGRVVWLILSYGLKLAAAGLVVGIAGALAATRLLSSMLFGIKPWDPFTFAVVTAFLLAVAIAASVIPALRGTIIDPMTALRRE